MKLLLLISICVLCAGCSWRECAAVPLEAFGGHKAAVSLGLRDKDSESWEHMLDRAKVEIPKTDAFKAVCEQATEYYYNKARPWYLVYPVEALKKE